MNASRMPLLLALLQDAESPLLPSAVAAPQMTSQMTVTAVVAFLLFVGAIASVWWASRRMRASLSGNGDGRPKEPSELVTPGLYRALRERGIASPESLAAMSPRERQLLLDAAGRMTPTTPMLAVGASPRSVAASGVAAAVAPAPPASVHCPVCGTRLAAWDTAAPRIVTRCTNCNRRISVRMDGDSRVVVTADVARDG